ncbi:MAG: hypothetical protein J6Z01_12055 [Bacteroidales bacterium]|nr:hypothetical protein [Bacteroidales bacterium]
MNKKRKNFKRTSTIESLPNVLLLTLQIYGGKIVPPNVKNTQKGRNADFEGRSAETKGQNAVFEGRKIYSHSKGNNIL